MNRIIQHINAHSKKAVLSLGLLFFGFLIYMALVFFKERVLAFDPAFFAFLMIEQKDFFIALGRWGSIFSQVIPLVALKSNCSLEVFLRLFSVAPIINYTILFLIITLVLKHYRAAFALMLVLCLGFRHAFFYTTAELYFGLALSILLWAIISPKSKNPANWKQLTAFLFSVLLIYIMSYLHQLTFFAIVFVICTEIILQRNYKDKHLWALLLITIAWYTIRIYFFTTSDYEKEKMPSVETFLGQLPNIRYLPSTMYFKYFATRHLWPLLLAFVISCVYLIKGRNWLYFLFLPSFSMGFLILILITYYKGESPLMYENYYTVLGVFAAIPLVCLISDNHNFSRSLLVFVIFISISCFGIYNSRTVFTKRIQYLDRLVSYGDKMPEKKYIVDSRNFSWEIGWIHWAVPFETLLYSSMRAPDRSVTVFMADGVNNYDEYNKKQNVFLGPNWEVSWFWTHSLNNKYFQLPPSPYKKLSSSQTDSAFNEKAFDRTNVTMQPLQDTYYSDADTFIVAEVQIKNSSGKILHSIPDGSHPICISYRLYDEKNNLLVSNGSRSLLEVDIKDEYIQGVFVSTPQKRGEYIVEVDLVTENIRWWNINSRFKLKVK